VVLIANIVSFGALMFPGNLSAGMPIAIWAMLIGSSIGGVWIALRTSLPPIATGIDSPTGAVLVLLGASVGSGVLGAGGSPAIAVRTVMLFSRPPPSCRVRYFMGSAFADGNHTSGSCPIL
jgi:hypothetical protein